MFARTFRAGIAVTALVASGLAIAGPALADPSTPPGAADYVGVGSDTIQIVMNDLAGGYNGTTASAGHKLASWDACVQTPTTCNAGGNISLRNGSPQIVRPNGSGAGKALLYGTGDNSDVTFARSSAALSTAEVSAGLYAYPFAKDTLVMVSSKNVASHAPAGLSLQQILGIYNGTYTNWSQLGGSPGVIAPKIPQTGSGTRSFFVAQLQAANGGNAVTLASSVQEVQEHDPTSIQGDANAISPFSKARLTNGLRTETGWRADRAVYNVVRSTGTAHPEWNVGSAQMEAVFGPSGYVCSAAARSVIEADGFKQLKSAADGGVCGVATQSAPSNLSVYNPDPASTSSNVSMTLAPSVHQVGAGSTAVVTVSGQAGTATGAVSLSGPGVSGSGQLNNGQAQIAIPASLPAGTYTLTASYAGDANYVSGLGSAVLTVTKAGSSLSASYPKTIKKGKRGKVTLRVSSSAAASGSVVVKRGRKVVGRGSVSGGVAHIKLAKLKKGKNRLTITYGGSGNVTGSSKTIVIKQK